MKAAGVKSQAVHDLSERHGCIARSPPSIRVGHGPAPSLGTDPTRLQHHPLEVLEDTTIVLLVVSILSLW